jgi:hypothetical protein
MEYDIPGIELVTKSDLLGLASWEKPRTTEQLLGFIARREAALSDSGSEADDDT